MSTKLGTSGLQAGEHVRDLLLPPEPTAGRPGCPEYAALPCTRQAIDDYLRRRADALGQPHAPLHPVYPDEWYADKNNRLAGKATGWLRFVNVGKGARCEWRAKPSDEKERSSGP